MNKKLPIRKKIRAALNDLAYLFTANMARRRFTMLNTLFPKSPDGKTLSESVLESFNNNSQIVDLGCGDKAQALVDLHNDGYENLYGIDLRPPKKTPKGIILKKTDITDTGFATKSITGTIYSSYVISYLEPKNQLKALKEIIRISGKGARGFIGPFQPNTLVDTDFHKKYPEYKNPVFGFVEKMNLEGRGKWKLYRSLQYISTKEIKDKKIGEYYYRIPIPLFNAYVMYGKSLLRKFSPNTEIKRDSNPKFSFEYYITFSM